MLKDRFDLPLTTASAEAADDYVKAVDLMLSANVGADALFARALERDPDFALAHAGQARLLQINAQPAEAQAAAARARALAETISPRERGHIEAIALAVNGKGADAYAAVKEHVAAFPRDAVPLSLALGVYGLLGFSGRADHHEAQRDLLESLAQRWDEDWWFLTYRGWSHVETGQPAKGIPMLDRALELHPRNAHGAHARAHAFYEAGDADTGVSFIARWLPDYDRSSQMHCHLSWHQALFMLQLGDVDGAMALYNQNVRPAVAYSPPLFTLADAASFLWRLSAYGEQVGAADWQEVEALATQSFPQAGLPFADVHTALALAGNGHVIDAAQRADAVQALADSGKLPAGPAVALLCRGAADFARGDWRACIDGLEPALAEMSRIGGSHAQRDVIEDTLIAAYVRAGDDARAKALAKARQPARAAHLDEAWLSRLPA